MDNIIKIMTPRGEMNLFPEVFFPKNKKDTTIVFKLLIRDINWDHARKQELLNYFKERIVNLTSENKAYEADIRKSLDVNFQANCGYMIKRNEKKIEGLKKTIDLFKELDKDEIYE